MDLIKNKKNMFMDTLKRILLWIWQLPQNILALICMLFIGKKNYATKMIGDVKCIVTKNITAGYSLGNYIFIKPWYSGITVQHEYGHCIQSIMLGPLYLIVIGLPSIIHNALHWWLKGLGLTWNYYSFPIEHWADDLGVKYMPSK